MKKIRSLLFAFLAAAMLAVSCSKTPQATRRLWLDFSAERGTTDDIAEIYIDGCLICNTANFADFTTPDKPRQIGYFPLTAGDHTVEVKAAGFKPWIKTIHIITGDQGVQSLHLHLER